MREQRGAPQGTRAGVVRRRPGAGRPSRSASSGPGQQGAGTEQGGDPEDDGDDAEVHGQGDAEAGRGGPEQAAGDRADAPDTVEGVEDRPPVGPLDAQAVGVLGDVDDRVQGAGQEEGARERGPVRCRGGRPDRGGEQGEAARGDPGGAEPADQRGRGQPRQEGAEGERGDRGAQRRSCSARDRPSPRGTAGPGSRRARR